MKKGVVVSYECYMLNESGTRTKVIDVAVIDYYASVGKSGRQITSIRDLRYGIEDSCGVSPFVRGEKLSQLRIHYLYEFD